MRRHSIAPLPVYTDCWMDSIGKMELLCERESLVVVTLSSWLLGFKMVSHPLKFAVGCVTPICIQGSDLMALLSSPHARTPLHPHARTTHTAGHFAAANTEPKRSR